VTTWLNRIVGHGEEAPDQLLANPGNWRTHPKAQQAALAGAISDIGFIRSVTVNQTTGHVVDGHLRVALALRNGEATIPVEYVEMTEAEEAEALVTLDPIAAMAAADKAQLDALLRDVQTGDAAVQAMLAELAAKSGLDWGNPLSENAGEIQARQTLAERFIVPPFSVLDARQGYWQKRKSAWIALGIQSELGRGENALGEADSRKGLARCYGQDLMKGENPHFGHGQPFGITSNLMANPLAARGQGSMVNQMFANAYTVPKGEYPYPVDALQQASGTSIFDPVLCEIAYRWFCPPGGRVLDPFAGGSVRGIVAALLGHQYTGIDLRHEQVAANEAQAGAIMPDAKPTWIVGDSRDLADLTTGPYDLIFSCPPYFDLELYSEDGRDLSNAGDYAAFLVAYRDIVAKSVAMLAPDRFACFVVGDIRDKKGFYRNFVSDTIAAFQDAGMTLYNDAILVTAVGSLPIRVGKQFGSYRKLGKTHQNVLIFYQGNPVAIKGFGAVECGDVAVLEGVGQM